MGEGHVMRRQMHAVKMTFMLFPPKKIDKGFTEAIYTTLLTLTFLFHHVERGFGASGHGP
jgi:hypothetical protein